MKNVLGRGAGRHRRFLGVVLACVLSLPAFLASQAGGQDANVVRSIRAVTVAASSAPAPTIEIELNSSREFPVRDEIVILRIGGRDFSRSRPPKDGSLNTLIFMLTADEFAQLPDGAAMSVRYGRGLRDESSVGTATARWDFGKLNKALLAQ